MADEPTVRGWLPPQAPGGQPPPRFEAGPEQPGGSPERDPDPAAEPEPQEAASDWLPPTADRAEGAGSADWSAPGAGAERSGSGAGAERSGSAAGAERSGSGAGAERSGSQAWQAPAAGAESSGSAGWSAPAAGSPSASPVDRSARYWGPPPASPPPPEVTGSTLAPPAPARAGALAITGVVLGSLGLALLVLSLGTSFLLSLPCSAIGWVCGAKARRRADADPAATRRGTAQTGVVLGMVGVGLGVVSAVTWIVLISAGITIDDLRDYLERKLREQRRDAGLLATLSVWLGR